MAALAHAKPLITTRAWSTDASVPWETACRVVAAGDTEGFAAAAAEVIADPALAGRLGREGLRLYETRFSWPVIARELVERMRA